MQVEPPTLDGDQLDLCRHENSCVSPKLLRCFLALSLENSIVFPSLVRQQQSSLGSSRLNALPQIPNFVVILSVGLIQEFEMRTCRVPVLMNYFRCALCSCFKLLNAVVNPSKSLGHGLGSRMCFTFHQLLVLVQKLRSSIFATSFQELRLRRHTAPNGHCTGKHPISNFSLAPFRVAIVSVTNAQASTANQASPVQLLVRND